jgi:hypothetical protein
MQMRQTANHPLLYRKNFDNDKLTEMAKVLCVKVKSILSSIFDSIFEHCLLAGTSISREESSARG